MKRRSLTLLLLLPLMAFDQFRHLLDEWPAPPAGDPREVTHQELQPAPRSQRWNNMLEWLRIHERLNGLIATFKTGSTGEGGLACSESMYQTLLEMNARVGERLAWFEEHCLQEGADPGLCHHEDQRISETAQGLSQISSEWASCYSGGGREIFQSFIAGNVGVLGGLDTNVRKVNPAVSSSGGGGGGALSKAWAFDEQHLEIYSDVRGSYYKSEETLLSYLARASVAWRPHLWEAGLGLKLSRNDQLLRPVTGTIESTRGAGANAFARIPLFSHAFRLEYGLERSDTTDSVYSGWEHTARIAFMFDEEQGFSRAFFASGSLFRADKEALMPNVQSLILGLTLKGPLEWGGQGELTGGIAEVRDSIYDVKPFPYLDFNMSIGHLPGYTWTGEPVGGWAPRTFEIRLHTFLKPERTYWVSAGLTFGAEPAVVWRWEKLMVPLEMRFRFEDDKGYPGSRRQEWMSGVNFSPSYEIVKGLFADLRLEYERSVLLKIGTLDSRLWAPQDSYTRWFFGGGLHYEF